jgi:large subunit ribosomal protein L4
MAKFDVVDLDMKKVSELQLSDEIFGAEPNANLFYEVAKMQQINRRRQALRIRGCKSSQVLLPHHTG